MGDQARGGSEAGDATPRVGFLFIGGEHQMLHMAPVAAAMLRMGDCDVRLFVGCVPDADRLAALLAKLGARGAIDVLATPAWLRATQTRGSPRPLPKSLQLLASRRMFRDLNALVATERTSTILARLPGRKPRLVHIPHGAGDRAQGFEDRLRLFDDVIVAGEKDRARMVGDGLVAASACHVSGYVKLSAVLGMRAAAAAPPLFGSGRPVVLYNPHFAAGLGSWPMFADAMTEAILGMREHDFVIAPHVRLAARLSPRDRQRLLDLAEPGRVLVDLGSARSSDMSYTLGADVYVGDVSSQVYEYLHAPGPCVFLNATGSDRRGDRDFAFWRFGEVVDDPGAVVAAITRAGARHPAFADEQRRGVCDAFGPVGLDAVRTAASIITDIAASQAASRSARSVRRARA